MTPGATGPASAPGADNSVTIAGTSGSAPLVVAGGGASASLGLTGNLALSGSYTTGALSAAGTLRLGAGSGIAASRVSVAGGTIALSGSGASLSSTGVEAIDGSGTVSLAAGANLEASTDLDVNSGSFTATGSGTTATISGNLNIGTPAVPYVNGVGSYGTSGSLSISGGAQVTVTGSTTANTSSITVSGAGSSLRSSNGLTLNGGSFYYAGALSAQTGASIILGSLSLNAGTGSLGSASPEVSVDSTSKIEIGSAGTAAAGTLTIDAGNSVTATTATSLLGAIVNNGTITETGGGLSINGSVVDNGTISVSGGTSSIAGALSGSGTVQIGANTTLQLNGTAAATDTIAFTGSSATLEIGDSSTSSYSPSSGYTTAYTPYAVGSSLSGFATGDSIIVDQATVTKALYTSTGAATGTLTLSNGSTAVETLNLSGANYDGRTFFVSQGSNGASVVTLLAVSNTAPILTESLTSDTGISPTDHLTNNPAVSGNGYGNTVVHLSVDGKAAPTTVMADALGAWAYTPSGLADGTHTIAATETTSGGTASTSLTFTLDTTPPIVSIDQTATTTSDAAQTITGTAESGGTVSIYDNNGAAALGTASVQSDGTWKANITLPTQGSNVLVARKTDAAGNTGSSKSVAYTLQVATPVISFADVAFTDTGVQGDGLTNIPKVTLSGTVTDAAGSVSVEVFDGSTDLGAAMVTGDAWTLSTNLTDGTHNSFKAVATGPDGNSATATNATSVDVDRVKPTVPSLVLSGLGITDGSGDLNAGKTITITIVTTKPVFVDLTNGTPTISLNDGGTATYVSGSGTAALVFAYMVAAGQNTVDVAATDASLNGGTIVDAAGNVPDLRGAITNPDGTLQIDTTPPLVSEALTSDTGSSSTDRITSNDALSGSGDPNAVVHFTVDGAAIQATATADASGAWSFTPAGLADGQHNIVASEADLAGNTGTASLTFTLDTTPPVVTGALTSDTGASSSDKITSNDALGGSGDPNVVVHFTVDGAAIQATATADASGAWSFTPAGLAEGQHTIVASETDLAGNTGIASLTFTLDTTPPAGTESLTNDTGASSSDRITSNEALAGSGDPNVVVHFTVDGPAIPATATADASGAWSFTPAGLADGQHTIVASETDLAGNTGTASLTFTLDTTPPVVTEALTSDTGASSSDCITSNDALGGSGDPNALVHFTVDGSAIQATATADASGAWSFTPAGLADGQHTIVASETDLAGNTGTASLTFTLDTTPPVVMEALTSDTGASSSDKITANEALGGSGDPNALVHFTVDGAAIQATATADASGAWSFTPAGLAEGQHTIGASETDLAGNTGTASLTFTLDTTPPVVMEALTSDTGASSSDKITANEALAGSGDPNAVVHFAVDGAAIQVTATANATGAWSFTPAGLADGQHNIVASEADLAGNTGTASLTFTLDTTPPAVTESLTNDTGASSSDKITSNDVLGGSGDPNAVVHFTLDGMALAGTATADATGAWSFTPAGLADGQHNIVASEADLAGNTGTASLTFTLDTTPPAVTESLTNDTGASSSDKITANGALGGSGDPNTVVHFTLDGMALAGTATADATGAWSFTPAGLADGQHNIVASEADLAGNTGTASLTFTLDTTPPAVTESLTNDTGASSSDKITANGALGGSGDPNAVVHFTVDGSAIQATATADASGAWSFTPAGLADGSHTIVASEMDVAGNTGTVPLTFTLGTKSPVVTISAVAGDDNIDYIEAHMPDGVPLGGTIFGLDAGTTFPVTVTNGGVSNNYTATVGSSGTWAAVIPSFDAITLTNGSATIIAQVTDVYGNTSELIHRDVTISDTPPTHPDLVVGSISVPTTALESQQVSISWTLKNTGTAAALGRVDGFTSLGCSCS